MSIEGHPQVFPRTPTVDTSVGTACVKRLTIDFEEDRQHLVMPLPWTTRRDFRQIVESDTLKTVTGPYLPSTTARSTTYHTHVWWVCAMLSISRQGAGSGKNRACGRAARMKLERCFKRAPAGERILTFSPCADPTGRSLSFACDFMKRLFGVDFSASSVQFLACTGGKPR